MMVLGWKISLLTSLRSLYVGIKKIEIIIIILLLLLLLLLFFFWGGGGGGGIIAVLEDTLGS